jgi:hypothetical protein
MDASKLSVSPDHIRFTPMGRNKKAQLRRKNVITLIRSKPAGTPITLSEFQVACAYTSTTAAYELVKDMIKRGTIVRTVEGFNRHSYTVAADAATSQRAEAKARAAASPELLRKTLGDFAKEFAWESDSDSLREFVKWMDSKELDLRRSGDRSTQA